MRAPTPSPTRTTCPYCGVGCGVLVSCEGEGFVVRGDPDHPANLGRLCSKGAALGETLGLDDRLLYPEIDGQRVDWDTALDAVAERFQGLIAEHGPDAVALYVSGQLLTEDYYVANKLMKGFIGSGNIDTNSRLCMSSAVAGQKRAFGSDTVPGCYEDLELADLVVLIGSNTAWAHPVVYQRLVAAKKTRPAMRVVLIDPRATATADLADLHLPIKPGADAWLFNGLLNHLKREDALNWPYLEAHVEGFGAALQAVSGLSIPKVAQECGLNEAAVAEFFRLFVQTPRTVTVFSQGINQSSSGVDKVNAILNVHLASGRIGQPGATPFSITGQPNAMGGREVGGLANQLAAHMDFTPEAIDRVGRFWRAASMAQQPGLKAVELFQAIGEGRIKAVWIIATNPVVSLPEADRVREALRACPFVVVSDVAARTDTGIHAHVRLPAAAWGEKDGTVSNSERRISRQRAFLPLPGEAKPDWWMLAEVGRRMGHAEAFAYTGPAQICAEHVALSAFENAGQRDFDLSGLLAEPDGTTASALESRYNALQPVQWPVGRHGGTARLFGDGRFFTASGKARMWPIEPRPPVNAGSTAFPWLLNSGRIRDQWHTMTRTAKTARLFAHIDQTYLEIHPNDARQLGIREGGLARVHNANGEMLARIQVSEGQQPGSLFAPIHWNDRFTGRGRLGSLVHASTDPISGQPEFKQTPVAVEPLVADWHGFVLTREEIDPLFDAEGQVRDEMAYWAKVRAKACWRLELAGTIQPGISPDAETDWPARLRTRLAADWGLNGDWIVMEDSGAGRQRGALIVDQRLLAVYFRERQAERLPPRHWLESLFERPALSPAERAALLLGSPGQAAPDCGRIVCACFGVGETELRSAIAAGADSVEALGLRLKAGSNCGSCIPELKKLLAQ